VICLACRARGVRLFASALCDGCAEQLSLETLRRLTLRDGEARNRLFQLLSAIRRDVPLDAIEVAA
jgi:hypothetical protein